MRAKANCGKIAAKIINDSDGSRETYRALWDTLNDVSREELLSWFCEWDGGAERWNPKPKEPHPRPPEEQ